MSDLNGFSSTAIWLFLAFVLLNVFMFTALRLSPGLRRVFFFLGRCREDDPPRNNRTHRTKLRGLCVAATMFLAAAASLAAPPEAPKVLKAKPGQMLRVSLKVDAEVGYVKNFSDETAFFGELVSPKGKRDFVFQADTPGVYVIGWWTKGELEGVATTITVVGVEPAPPPKPLPPEPGPGPKPPEPDAATAKNVIVVILEETMRPFPNRAAILYDKAFRDWAKAGGHQIEIVDVSDPAATAAGYKPYAERLGVPSLLVFDASKSGVQVPLLQAKLPDSAATLTALVQKAVKK